VVHRREESSMDGLDESCLHFISRWEWKGLIRKSNCSTSFRLGSSSSLLLYLESRLCQEISNDGDFDSWETMTSCKGIERRKRRLGWSIHQLFIIGIVICHFTRLEKFLRWFSVERQLTTNTTDKTGGVVGRIGRIISRDLDGLKRNGLYEAQNVILTQSHERGGAAK